MAGSNVCVGIDAGTRRSKLGYGDSLGTRIIGGADGFDLNALREEAEAFFDEPVFSGVIAVPEGFGRRQREDIEADAKSSGFRDVNIITGYEAMNLVLNYDVMTLVCDFGASRTDFAVLRYGGVIAREALDACGDSFDRMLAGYLADLRLIDSPDEAILNEARRIKHVLSKQDSMTWHERTVTRDDFERLIYFPVRRSSHVAEKLVRVHRPERIILTGGGSNVPLVRRVFAGISTNVETEIDGELIVRGVAVKARAYGRESRNAARTNAASRLQALRAGIIELEDILTRSQKDRLYAMFRQAEGINDSGIITLMENLIRELKNAG